MCSRELSGSYGADDSVRAQKLTHKTCMREAHAQLMCNKAHNGSRTIPLLDNGDTQSYHGRDEQVTAKHRIQCKAIVKGNTGYNRCTSNNNVVLLYKLLASEI